MAHKRGKAKDRHQCAGLDVKRYPAVELADNLVRLVKIEISTTHAGIPEDPPSRSRAI